MRIHFQPIIMRVRFQNMSKPIMRAVLNLTLWPALSVNLLLPAAGIVLNPYEGSRMKSTETPCAGG